MKNMLNNIQSSINNLTMNTKNILDNIKINLSEKWIPITGNVKLIDNGAYFVTLIDSCDRRKIELATYLNGTWVPNNPSLNEGCKVIAYLPTITDNILPFDGNIQRFKVGDVIVWNNDDDKEKKVMCWMIIGSFDYPSDRAARAKVGKEYFSKDVQTTYTGWSPNKFGKNTRLATDDEISKICDELLIYYKTNFNVHNNNVGKSMLKLDLQELRPDLYDRIIDMWDEEENND